jgi:uncharacterized protein YndB with AHSA1/START domain
VATNDYAFVTEWRLEAPRELLFEILLDGEQFPRWWPEVYLSAEATPAPDGGEIGRTVRLHTKGRLPYTLRWTAETIRVDRPNGFEIRATGDFDGRGVWTLKEEGATTLVRFDWRLRAEKPILRTLSFALKPLFAWNHRWAMARGETGLRTEAARRLAASA